MDIIIIIGWNLQVSLLSSESTVVEAVVVGSLSVGDGGSKEREGERGREGGREGGSGRERQYRMSEELRAEKDLEIFRNLFHLRV